MFLFHAPYLLHNLWKAPTSTWHNGHLLSDLRWERTKKKHVCMSTKVCVKHNLYPNKTCLLNLLFLISPSLRPPLSSAMACNKMSSIYVFLLFDDRSTEPVVKFWKIEDLDNSIMTAILFYYPYAPKISISPSSIPIVMLLWRIIRVHCYKSKLIIVKMSLF